MAVENANAVAARARAPHVERAARVARPAASPGDGDAPATGFSALLGAAAEAPETETETEPSADEHDTNSQTDKEGDGSSTRTGRASRGSKASAQGGPTDDAAVLAAWSGLLQPAAPVPVQAPVATAAAATAGTADATTGIGALAARGGHFGVNGQPLAMAGDAAGAGAAALAHLKLPGAAAGKPGPALAADATAPGAQATAQNALDNTAGTATSHGKAAPAFMADGSSRGTLAGAQQLRVNQMATQAATERAQAAIGTGAAGAAADASALGGVSINTSVTGVPGEANGQSGRAASTVSLADGNAVRWASVLSEIARPQAEAGAGGFAGGASSRQGQGGGAQSQGNEGIGAAGLGFAATGSAADTGFQPAAATADAQGLAGDSGMSTDEWLAATTPSLNSREVQNAELTVDAFGAPVDVRISLSGSEAQVAFQSDQADTRAMLGATVSDLQNLLQREGLVLSGVTVGSSGAQQSGGQAASDGGGNRGGSRRAQAAETPGIEAASGAAARPSRPAAGRGSLDLYA